jgi:hypothetical protein
MTRPTVEVADILHTHGDRFIEQNRSWLSFQHLKVFRRYPALPHLRAGRSCRQLFALRSLGHLVQLVPYGEFFLMGSSRSEEHTATWQHALSTLH